MPIPNVYTATEDPTSQVGNNGDIYFHVGSVGLSAVNVYKKVSGRWGLIGAIAITGDLAIPITLNPGDVLARDGNANPILSYETLDSLDSLVLPPKVSTATEFGTDINIPAGCDLLIKFGVDGGITCTADSGTLDLIASSGDPNGGDINIESGQSNADPDGRGGDVNIRLGTGHGTGRDGIVDINGSLLVERFFQLTPLADAPTPSVEGMIYADTDHHLYYYNGTTWKQLDN